MESLAVAGSRRKRGSVPCSVWVWTVFNSHRGFIALKKIINCCLLPLLTEDASLSAHGRFLCGRLRGGQESVPCPHGWARAAPALSAGAAVSAGLWAGGRAAARGPAELLLLCVIIGGSLKRGDNN